MFFSEVFFRPVRARDSAFESLRLYDLKCQILIFDYKINN